MIKDPMQWDSELNKLETKAAVRGTNATMVINLNILLILNENGCNFRIYFILILIYIQFLIQPRQFNNKFDTSANKYNSNIVTIKLDLLYDVGLQKDEDELNH